MVQIVKTYMCTVCTISACILGRRGWGGGGYRLRELPNKVRQSNNFQLESVQYSTQLLAVSLPTLFPGSYCCNWLVVRVLLEYGGHVDPTPAANGQTLMWCMV